MLKYLRTWPGSSSELRIKYSPLNPLSTGHRRQLSLASFSTRRSTWLVCAALTLLAICLLATSQISLLSSFATSRVTDEDGLLIWGKTRFIGDHEIFWWEQFPRLIGYYHGRHDLVPFSSYVPEQDQSANTFLPQSPIEPRLKELTFSEEKRPKCSYTPPKLKAYHGVVQGMSSALLGSMEELGIRQDFCYDRINRFGPYGLVGTLGEGGLGIELHGDNEDSQNIAPAHYEDTHWNRLQDDCIRKNEADLKKAPRTAFIIRTWHTFEYTPHHIIMLRAMVNELSMRTGGQIYVHFLIHVQDDSIPIWASEEVYNETLRASLPAEFADMGTLWSVAQMRLVYPPPFPNAIINFSGGDLYDAYRSLHFPLQYFASQHPEFDYIWQWEIDIRVTGHYGELLERVSNWADNQSRDHLWERSSKFYIPSYYNNSFADFSKSVVEQTAESGQNPISGPQLPAEKLLAIPLQPAATQDHDITDLITFSPIFDPTHTRWAFHDDITGYSTASRPPTRAALITASRMSRRLLMLMHEETFRKKHTMFPEMYPASIALHYGLKAVYAPVTTYFDRDWPATHANEIFNNAKLSPESVKKGMSGSDRYFHGRGGSVFGPGEHVFRGASWYSNAGFAGYLWRRWLGNENGNDEVAWELGEGHRRMCLPMMILHPIKSDD